MVKGEVFVKLNLLKVLVSTRKLMGVIWGSHIKEYLSDFFLLVKSDFHEFDLYI